MRKSMSRNGNGVYSMFWEAPTARVARRMNLSLKGIVGRVWVRAIAFGDENDDR